MKRILARSLATLTVLAGVGQASATPPAAPQPRILPAVSWKGQSGFSFSIGNPGRLPLVKATVNGTPGVFLIDTGAEVTVLTPKFANSAKLGDRIRQQGAQVNGKGGGVEFALVGSLRVGSAGFRDFHALLLDISHLKKGLGVEPAGIIGNNVLMRAPLTLDYRSGKGVWNGPAPEGAVAAGCLYEGLSIYLAASIDGQPLCLLVDTGSSVNALLRKDWKGKTANRGEGDVAVAGGSGKKAVVTAEVAKLVVGALPPRPATFRLTDTHRCLGTPFFKGRAVHFNAGKRQVLLTPAEG